jgi:predicted metal-dependent enzyme (double-stranded beta helix superfamily)
MMTPIRLLRTVRAIKSSRQPEPETLSALSGAVAAFVHDSRAALGELPRLSAGAYSRALLNDPDDDFQVVLVSWAPGQASPIHDHSHNVGVVAGLLGDCEETKYRVVARGGAEGGGRGEVTRLEVVATTRLGGSYVTPLVDDDERQLHAMYNPSRDAWAATVHVYLEAMGTFNIYRDTGRAGHFEAVESPLWFDQTGLWRRWPELQLRAA